VILEDPRQHDHVQRGTENEEHKEFLVNSWNRNAKGGLISMCHNSMQIIK